MTERVCKESLAKATATPVLELDDYRRDHGWMAVKATCGNCGKGSEVCSCGCGKMALFIMRDDWDPDRLQCPDCGEFALRVTHYADPDTKKLVPRLEQVQG